MFLKDLSNNLEKQFEDLAPYRQISLRNIKIPCKKVDAQKNCYQMNKNYL